jgi:hypothetical protein
VRIASGGSLTDACESRDFQPASSVVNSEFDSLGYGPSLQEQLVRVRLGSSVRRRPSRMSIVRVQSGVNPESLRLARLRAGLTQHELARLISVAGG